MAAFAGVFCIIISLGLLMYLAYKGVSVIILAPVLAVFTYVAEGFFTDLHGSYGLATLTETFMGGMSNYIFNYFLIFLLGAVFGKLMDSTGSALKIARIVSTSLGNRRAVLAVIISCSILTYGGVSLFVVAFAAYPIAAELFREANIPRRFLPATIAVGAVTFTMTALPGSPQIQNAIPMKYFGTDVYAAPVIGIVCSIIMLGLSYAWISYRVKTAKAAGYGFDEDVNRTDDVSYDNLPSGFLALLPAILVLVINFIFSKFIFVNMDLSYLIDNYGKQPSDLIGNWSLIVALIIAIVVCLITNLERQRGKVRETLNDGIQGSFIAMMNTAAVVGYGGVIKTLAAFNIVKEGIIGLSDNPLIAGSISSTVLAGITGSASGGLSIALEALSGNLMAMADSAGISYEALHRITAIASGGIDTLPHNGAVVTLLVVTATNHKSSYFDIFVVSVAIPLVALIVAIVMGTLGIC